VYPANLHTIRAATPLDAHALHRLARAEGKPPLTGPVLVAEVRGAVAAAISRDGRRTLRDPAVAPAYLTSILRLRATALAAFEREPDLGVRVRRAVLGDGEAERLPLAA
jgi:hypothetical protein